MHNFILTENGSTQINKGHKDARSAVYTSGTLGVAAVATISYKNAAGSYIPFTDGLLVIGDQIHVDHGIGVDIYVVLSNVDVTTSVEVMCAAVD